MQEPVLQIFSRYEKQTHILPGGVMILLAWRTVSAYN